MIIFVTGYMGCGKTTFGRALAKRLNIPFIDLDFYIEQRFHSKIAEIFASRGEDDFRRIEAALLREVGEFTDAIVACGGGTPCFADNMDYMNARGLTVWLQASTQCLTRRIILGGAKRPITAGVAPEELPYFIDRHLSERTPHYSKAAIKFDGEELENTRQINSTIEAFVKELTRRGFLTTD